MNKLVNKINEHFTLCKKAYISCNGLSHNLNLHTIHSCIIDRDTLYFGIGKCERGYGEISQNNNIVLLIDDSNHLIKIKGTICFVDSKELSFACYQSSLYLQKQFPEDPQMIIPFFFESAIVEEYLPFQIEPIYQEVLTNVNGLKGIEIEKNVEIKERLLKLLEQRIALDTSNFDDQQRTKQKEIDGRLLYFLITAKQIWKRMNIQPIEFVILYETYDEREKYINQAKNQIGNVKIKQVEDLTYYLSI